MREKRGGPFRRALSLLLSLAMLATLAPVAALANTQVVPTHALTLQKEVHSAPSFGTSVKQNEDLPSFSFTAKMEFKGEGTVDPTVFWKNSDTTIKLSSDKSGKIDFGELTFPEDGEYVITVTEDDIPDTIVDGEYTKDPNTITVTYTVVDGELTNDSPVITKEEKVFSSPFSPEEPDTFINLKTATYIELTGKKELLSNSILPLPALKGGEFAFEVEYLGGHATDDTPLDISEDYNPPTFTKEKSFANKADGTIIMDGIKVTAPGTYHFKITETKDTAKSHIEYDDTVYRAEVVVNADLSVEKPIYYIDEIDEEKQGEEVEVSFLNTVKDHIQVEKVSSTDKSKKLPDAKFTLYRQEIPTGQGEFDPTNLPDEWEKLGETTTNPLGIAIFLLTTMKADDEPPDLAFNYRYKLVEDAPPSGYNKLIGDILFWYEYDNGSHTLNWHHLGTNGNDSKYVAYSDSTNTFTVQNSPKGGGRDNPTPPSKLEPVDVNLRATKTVDGKAPGSARFEFALKSANNRNEETVKNDSRGNISFPKLTFESVGTYKYTFKEIADPDDKDYTFDTSVYTATIKVTKNGDKLEAEVTYTRENGEAVNGIPSFDNKYIGEEKPVLEPVLVTLSARKSLEGARLTDGMFQFALTDPQGNRLESQTNDANAAVTFDRISFSEAGSYSYRIAEIAGTLPFMTYDPAVYEVEVTVTENEEESRLDASVTYYQLGADGSRGAALNGLPIFQNVAGSGGEEGEEGEEGDEGDQDEYVQLDENGNPLGTWKLDENGEWVFIPDEAPPQGGQTPTEPQPVPQTGDETPLYLYAGLALLFAILAIAIYPRKRGKRSK